LSMKIGTIIGARPQFIKAAPVSRALRERGIAEVVIHTGQHYDSDMSEIFFRELRMKPPDYHLGIGSGSHGVQTGKMLAEVERVVLSEQPDLVLVYGDTNSTLAGSLVAAKVRIPSAHVEAGLRSFNRSMPEEVNRIVADVLADTLFAPTEVARANLEAEGIRGEKVHVVGDVMFDVALEHGSDAVRRRATLSEFGLNDGNYLLATIHRAENTDNPERLRVIIEALLEAGKIIPVIWPIHPRTKHRLAELGIKTGSETQLRVIAPVGYLQMASLEAGAALIVTDSGGVQKEAFFHRVPCVTVRFETEWLELVAMGWNRLAPPSDVRSVVQAIQGAIGTVGKPGQPYGSGHAARQIADILSREIGPRR